MVVKNITRPPKYKGLPSDEIRRTQNEPVNLCPSDFVDTPDYVLKLFFSYGVLSNASREEVEKSFGFSQKKLWRWRKFVIDKPPLNCRKEFRKAFYYSQKREQNKQTQGVTPYQLFIYWLISILLHKEENKPRRTYKEVASILQSWLKFFTPDKFKESLQQRKVML